MLRDDGSGVRVYHVADRVSMGMRIRGRAASRFISCHCKARRSEVVSVAAVGGSASSLTLPLMT